MRQMVIFGAIYEYKLPVDNAVDVGKKQVYLFNYLCAK